MSATLRATSSRAAESPLNRAPSYGAVTPHPACSADLAAVTFEAVADRSTRDRVSVIRVVERRYAGETICTIEGPETRVVTDNGLTAGDLAGLIVNAPKLVNALREAAANIGQPMHQADALRMRNEWAVLLGSLSAVAL